MSFTSFRFLMIGILVSTVLLGTSSAQAQAVPDWASALSLIPSVNSPLPDQELSIKAESYTVDLNSSTITWTAGGKEIARGVGKTEVTVRAPALGKTLRVTATAVTVEGQRLTNSVTLGSGDIDIIVESDGYVPPFYSGKTPLVYQNEFRVIAIPHLVNSAGKEYDPTTLVYEWKKDWKVLQKESGYGKSSISLIGDIVPRPYLLSVTVTSRDGRVRAEKFTTISHGEPFIVFYEDDPQYGALFNRARWGTLSLGSSKEVSLFASPYGFAQSSNATDLSYNWTVNGLPRDELSANRSITLRAPADSAGSSIIGLEVRNLRDILQGSKATFTATFSKPAEQASNVSF